MLNRLKRFIYRTKISYYERMIAFRGREFTTNQITLAEYNADVKFMTGKIRLLTDKLQKL